MKYLLGTLIHESWILTAAHCLDVTQPSQLEILLGAHNWKKNKPEAQRLKTVQFITHSEYDSESC